MAPIKTKWITIIITIAVLFVFVTTKYQNGKNKEQSRFDCYIELNKEISGVISKAYDSVVNSPEDGWDLIPVRYRRH
jgi:hypothetical protein